MVFSLPGLQCNNATGLSMVMVCYVTAGFVCLVCVCIRCIELQFPVGHVVGIVTGRKCGSDFDF